MLHRHTSTTEPPEYTLILLVNLVHFIELTMGPAGPPHRSRWMVLIVLVVIPGSFAPPANTQREAPYEARTDNTSPEETQDDPGICLTPGCVKAAAKLMEGMDTEIDPCDDFFQYACGGWNRKHVIPDDRSNYNTIAKISDELQVTLKSLLEAPVTPDELLATRYAKYFYQSCMNTSFIESRQDAPLRSALETLGGWPVLDPNWDEASFDVTTLMAELGLLNKLVLVAPWVRPDDNDSTVNIIQINQPSLGMPSRDYFLKDRTDPTLMAYQTYAVDFATLLNGDPERSGSEMEQMVEFEIRLANISTPKVIRRNKQAMYSKVKLTELSNITQEIDWKRYMNLVFANVSLTISDDQDVVVYATDYLHHLGPLLAVTPKRTIANYLMWRFVISRVDAMPTIFNDARRIYRRVLYGTDRDRPRWSTCVNSVNQRLGMAVGRMFIQEHFDENSKSNALDMIAQIKSAFINELKDVPWMDNRTREVAREKAISIQQKIGYPDYITNDTALNADYDEIEIVQDQYFENVLATLNAATRKNMKKIVLPVDSTEWFTYPAIVNAYYLGVENQITFPAGILQPPVYHESYPKSMNFGGIGMVIGHEITHGFDDKGRQYDKDGNLKQWWSDSVIDRFTERAQCIVDQYGNFTVPQVGMNLNGRMTQGENIADNGGVKQAFRAYRMWVAEQGHEEPTLPGLSLTHDQLFFLNFGQLWCGSSRPQTYIRYITSSSHSPNRFRVIGSLSNSQEFAEAFSCPSGSRMNPDHKCSVW